MPPFPFLISALMLQLAAQTVGGIWGAAVGGLLIGLGLRRRGAFRVGFLAAAVAALLLLIVTAVRGDGLLPFASALGANFKVPGWALLLVSVLLPALQSAGFAGGLARLFDRGRR
ncbi:MAG: hypothetical protein RLZZ621_254 [Gemmatimonadota bacterium]|jgi:hypothetical protein